MSNSRSTSRQSINELTQEYIESDGRWHVAHAERVFTCSDLTMEGVMALRLEFSKLPPRLIAADQVSEQALHGRQ